MVKIYINHQSSKIIKVCGTNLLSLVAFILIPLSSAQAQQTTNSATNPSNSSRKSNVAGTQRVSIQRFVGKRRWYNTQGFAGSARIIDEYIFNSDGTFEQRVGVEKGFTTSGRYQVSGNALNMTYSNRRVKRYSFTFRDDAPIYNGEIPSYLFLTEPGSTEPHRYQKVKPKNQ